MFGSNNKIWLTRKQGDIQGPFTENEVKSQIESAELHAQDQVTCPGYPWHMIHNHKKFLVFLKEDSTNTVRQTQRLTAVTESLISDIEESPSALEGSVPPPQTSLPTKPTPGKKSSKLKQTLPQASVKAPEPNPSIPPRKTKPWAWFLIFSTLVLGVGFFLFDSKQNKVTLNPSEKFEQGERLFKKGQHKAALKFYKLAYEAGVQTPSWRFMSLALFLETNTTLARKALGTGDEFENLLGVLKFLEGNRAGAIRHLRNFLKKKPSSWIAHLNLGVLLSLEGRHSMALKSFATSSETGPKDSPAKVLQVQFELNNVKGISKNEEILKRLTALLKSYLKTGYQYRQEALLLLAKIELLRNRPIEPLILDFLDQDMATNYIEDPLLYSKSLSWVKLGMECKRLESQLAGWQLLLFQATCALRQGQWDQATVLVNQAVGEWPKEPLALALQSYLFERKGLLGRASVSRSRAQEADRRRKYGLPRVFHARFCQKTGDIACAQETWLDLLQNNAKFELQVTAGLAQVFAKEGKRSVVATYIARGLQTSPNFRPLLELQMEQQENSSRDE